MADRVTRVPQSRELVRAKRLHQALERGAPPAFVPPVVPNPVKQPSSLSWSRVEDSGKTNSKQKEFHENKVLKKPSASAASISEQLFQNSPDPLIISDVSFRAQCVNQEFQRMFGYSAAHLLGKSVDQLIFPCRSRRRSSMDRTMPAAWRTPHPRNSTPLQRRHPARRFRLLCSPHPRRPHRRFLHHLSRHFRAQTRQGSHSARPYIALPTESQRHPGSPAVLRRHPRHRR